jgi:hypothetical protein
MIERLLSLSNVIAFARRWLSTTPASSERAIGNDGARAWWQLPTQARERVVAMLELTLQPLRGVKLDPKDKEAIQAAIALLAPTWRESVIQQIASLRPLFPEDDSIAEAQAALSQRRLGEIQSAAIADEELRGPSRPVFECASASFSVVAGWSPPGLSVPCPICHAAVGFYCDPKEHSEVPEA